jgi:iron complex outermembrane recepter protein
VKLTSVNGTGHGAAPGGSGLGGAVNVLPKRAPNDPLSQVTTGVQTGGQLYGAVDVARRYQDERLGLRLNGALRDGDTAVDGESASLGLIALGVDWRAENLRLSADLGYQDLRLDASQPNITIASGLDIPDAPDASVSVAQSWTYSDARDLFGVLRGEYDLSETWTAWAAVGTRQGDEENRFANPTVIAADGTTSSYRFDNVREDSVWTGEIGVRGEFATGPVDHQLSFSANAYELESENAYAFSDFAGFAGNIYDPFDAAAPPANFFVGGDMDNPLVTEKVNTSSLAVADMITMLDERLILTGGLRYQTIENSSYNYNTGDKTADYDESRITPVAGILYKINRCISPYVNYIEGLTKGDVAPASVGGVPVANAGEVLEPYVTQQIEAGVKFDYGNIGGAVSVFQSEKPIAGINDDDEFEEIGDQRYRGLELTAYGEPIDGLRLLGGVSFLDTEKSGLDQIGAPTTQLNFGAEWDVPWVSGLTVDGRVIHTGSQYADAANTQKVPSWTRFDLGLRHTTEFASGNALTFRARVENVANDDYWASAGGYPGRGYLTVGGPRTLVVSATFEF